MENFLKVLLLEDNLSDAEIIRDVIINAGMHCHFHHADRKDSFITALDTFRPEVILADNSLPQFNSEEALIITRQKYPFVPFILVTGTVSEEYAVKITKSGADDYILKDRLARLPASIETALQYRKAEIQLQETFAENEMLAGRMSAILNTIPANIALLDSAGCIIDVNDAWRKFADKNNYKGLYHGIGINYIDVSKKASGNEKKDGTKVAKGIKAVLDNTLKEFVFEYPCHNLKEKRWFRMIVTPLSDKVFSGVVVMHIDITEIRKLEQERLENKINEHRKLTKAILQAQEKERNEIGSELHDNVNQILTGTKLLLSTAKINAEKREEIIDNCIINLQYAIDENRKIAHELVAPDFQGIKLEEQINILAEGMLRQGNINLIIETNTFREELLQDDQKLAVYRVAQEHCTNILKHAQATSVTITLSVSAGIFEMKMADNGKGMEKGASIKGIGFKNIRSRLELFGGTLYIETEPAKGFTMRISFPLTDEKAAL